MPKLIIKKSRISKKSKKNLKGGKNSKILNIKKNITKHKQKSKKNNKNENKNKKSQKKTIFYTGVGALKSGKHTEEEYLEIMDKNFDKDCKRFLYVPKCKDCVIEKKLTFKLMDKIDENPKYKLSKKEKAKKIKLVKACAKCLETKPNCNLMEYLDFSGAEQKL